MISYYNKFEKSFSKNIDRYKWDTFIYTAKYNRKNKVTSNSFEESFTFS